MNNEMPEFNKRLFSLIENVSSGVVADFVNKIKVSHQVVNRCFNIDTRSGKYPKPSIDIIIAIADNIKNVSLDWLVMGNGEMFKMEQENSSKLDLDFHPNADIKRLHIETRPRIPLNAAAGTVSVALSGVTADDSEQLPIIQSFSNYSYTILVKGDSMEPEFHSGDELACLQLTNGKAKFIQWGRYHVLDTSQGIVIKRIYEKEEYIICKSENKDLYPDFEIHKDDIYNIGLVIGMLRRF